MRSLDQIQQQHPSADRAMVKIVALTDAHDDLDSAISALLANGTCDDLLIRRLKKRKLQLRDQIAEYRVMRDMAGPENSGMTTVA